MPKKLQVRNGDLFLTRMPDGRYGAIRVIKTENGSHLIATTEYLRDSPPEISDPAPRKVLVKNFCAWKDQESLCIYKCQITAPYIGNLPLTSKEEQMKVWGGVGGFPSGSWGEWVGRDVYSQWRWNYDRKAFEEELRIKKEAAEKVRRVQPTPGKLMDDVRFWEFIRQIDWSFSGNDDLVLKPIVSSVSALPKQEIYKFVETLSYKLFLLDTESHAVQFGESDGYISEDGFLYARCAVLANGDEFYTSVLNDPSKMPKDLEFEALLSVGPKAYSLRTGGEDLEYTPRCSYETRSNRDGWKD